MRKVTLYGTLAVVLATLAQMAHGATHDEAGVPLVAWQWAYAIAVVFVAPIAAAVLLWGRFLRASRQQTGSPRGDQLVCDLRRRRLALRRPTYSSRSSAGSAVTDSVVEWPAL